MSEANNLRSYQREASEASRGALAKAEKRDVADLIAELERRIWPEKCLESERKFGHRAARLYPLIGVSGGVQTPLGQGTLIDAKSYGCRIVLTRQKATGIDTRERKYRPTRNFAVEEVMPYATRTKGKR